MLYICICFCVHTYVYILESTGALRAPLILRIRFFGSGFMTSKVAALRFWGPAAACLRLDA